MRRCKHKSTLYLAVLIAAEERHKEDVGEIRESIDQSIAEFAERSSTRVRLAELVGSAADEHAVAAAVGATLFGSGAPDDDGSAFFAGSSEADYYDPANSFFDVVLQRILAADRKAVQSMRTSVAGMLGGMGELLASCLELGETIHPDLWQAGAVPSDEQLTLIEQTRAAHRLVHMLGRIQADFSGVDVAV